MHLLCAVLVVAIVKSQDLARKEAMIGFVAKIVMTITLMMKIVFNVVVIATCLMLVVILDVL
jgi:hypothetical protein